MNNYRSLLLLTVLSLIGQIAHAQSLRLPGVFTDHMVLQRDMPVRFWGWSKPQAGITVEINGATVKTEADAQGSWKLAFPATAAGGPYEVVVQSAESAGGETLRLKDVYFGDVWIASGQSNMEWKLAQAMNAANEIKDSNYPLIRFFEVPNVISHTPLPDISGGQQWVPANPQTAGNFSAVAWFFAKLNHREKNVAVGIIDSTWGGTPAEAWVDANRLLSLKDYENEARFALDPAHDWKTIIAANEANERLKWQMIGDKQRVLGLKVYREKFNDSGWHKVTLPNTQPLSNFAWLRKSFEISGNADVAAEMQLGDLVQDAMVFVNGKLIAEENWKTEGATYQLPAGTLKKGKNVIALRVANDWNNEVYAGKPGQMFVKLVATPRINLEGEWRYSNTIEPEMPTVFRYNWTPGFLYNAMIHPIEGYSIRGAIWYQGESNTDRATAYASLFQTLITDWRAKWNQGDFPFLYVQLAAFAEGNTDPGWPLLREAQAATLKLPNTGMAVTMDIGEPDDIHPRNKQDVGKRLWLNARKVAFKEKVHNSGPVYKSHKIKGDKVILSFDHVGHTFMLATPPNIKGFEIAGADKQFHPAEATFKGDLITVWSPEVPSPVAVRYAWKAYFDVDLFSWDMLPMAPFRTDNW